MNAFRRAVLAAGLLALAAAAIAWLGSPGSARGQGVTVFADIVVTQTDTPDPVPGNQRLTYDVEVRNDGPGLALVAVVMQAPPGSAVEDAPNECAIEESGRVSCIAFPALSQGGSFKFQVVTRPRTVGTITNTVSVTPLLPDLDPDTQNNISEEQTTVTQPIGPRNCRGREPTIVADPDGGVLRGTRADDVIVGLDGNDRIRGGGGKDRVCGSGGDDTIKGGAGVDNLKGGAGSDSVSGGSQNDKIAGSADDDRLSGGSGSDRVRASSGDDLVKAGSDDDRVAGGGGDDELNGAGDDDRLAGQGGDDEVNGRGGDDSLTGGGGSNLLDGGAGRDSCRGNGVELRCERG